jgi:hypothetical protein
VRIVGPRARIIDEVAHVDDILAELMDEIEDEDATPSADEVLRIAGALVSAARLIEKQSRDWKANSDAALSKIREVYKIKEA